MGTKDKAREKEIQRDDIQENKNKKSKKGEKRKNDYRVDTLATDARGDNMLQP